MELFKEPLHEPGGLRVPRFRCADPTPCARLRLARLIVEEGWPPSVAAKMFMVSPVTARKWAARFRAEGAGGMIDRSSRLRSMRVRTPLPVVKRIMKARWRRRLGPVQIASELGLAASTVHAVLMRCRINRLSSIDRLVGEPIRRDEHDHPGSLIHVDVTKFGNIPDDGGWRFVGRVQGERNRETTATRTQSRNHRYEPRLRTAFVHTVIDDHSRVASAEIHTNEKAATAIGVLRRAVSWPADRGVSVERVLSDNGSAYKSHAWREVCAEPRITAEKTRPHRPQTNGKIERFHRVLADGWAYAKLYPLRDHTTRSTPWRAALLQLSQAPLHHRSPAHQHDRKQPAWTSH